MAELRTPLFEPQPTDRWVRNLVRRSQRRLDAMAEPDLDDLLEDALYNERKRLERSDAEPNERANMERLSKALVRGGRREKTDAGLSLVATWGHEIHGSFNPRVYKVATRFLPQALTVMLADRPRSLRELRHWDLSVGRRLRVEGEVPFLKELIAEGATLVLAPTHVSNMDSPLIGMALYQADLPPFVYGAGLNLFDNRIFGWWMHRLGAYTVDRRKRARLYKDVLKDYSVLCMKGGLHSLFFPGGTRCRSGALEQRVKKGLLGTAIQAWEENLDEGNPRPEIYVVPLTLSYQLVLEASTLISDHLAEQGRQRYIIDDDEFSQPGQVANWMSRMLALDAGVVCRFGRPVDALGTLVPRDAGERAEANQRRRRYVTDSAGHVEFDLQRDFRYTDRLADSLVAAYRRDTTVMATHLVARVAWTLLSEARGTTDPFRLVRTETAGRRLDRSLVIARLDQAMARVRTGANEGLWHHDLPANAPATLNLALDRFDRFHKTRALAEHGDDIVIEDPRLCLYYQNRLSTVPLEV